MPETREMVEAVARAICRTRCQGEAHPCDKGSDGICKPGFCLDWRLYAEGAEAAIQAMREPGDVGDWPKYLAGEWSRRNLEAFVDDALASPEEEREP